MSGRDLVDRLYERLDAAQADVLVLLDLSLRLLQLVEIVGKLVTGDGWQSMHPGLHGRHGRRWTGRSSG